ncbi:hypothetical protein HYPDE_30778 [Hyphomicrobium denitrificans 1NES1]|uniref:PAS domain-containing protein n=1 Tax=Hyphomicrobium denitrificans 1NES1 TaxID=670307 RepID=N0BCI2_9HYPH|nr:PAS domain-containing protein [Hyphomicrobium denitrificans]AGK57830.1 hypothetical protein HYPDE_30778 [Hyphomicrobium denitrificans 1NES1]
MLMQESVSQALYSYWNSLRGDRVAPKRFEIEPSCISASLPDTFILERIAPSALRFRLAGTRICEAFGIDFRGVNLFRLFDDADVRILERQIAMSASDGAVCVFRIKAGNANGFSADFELLILPLTHTRNTIDRFLGALTPMNRPDWLGTVVLTQRKLISHEIVWPNGIPLPAEIPQNRPPIMPAIREARIVRSNRRQFRVYEGGLGRSDNE